MTHLINIKIKVEEWKIWIKSVRGMNGETLNSYNKISKRSVLVNKIQINIIKRSMADLDYTKKYLYIWKLEETEEYINHIIFNENQSYLL